MSKLFNRLLRPAVLALALGSFGAPVMAQDAATQLQNMLDMLNPSVTGS